MAGDPDGEEPEAEAAIDVAQGRLDEAVAMESVAHRLLLDGERERARVRFHDAAVLYRQSWEAAKPDAYGRLVGMLKASVLSGSAQEEARYVRALHLQADSPVAAYALAISALVASDDATARRLAQRLRTASDAFRRAGEGIAAIADRDPQRTGEAIAAIAADFEARDEHLTGVRIADTALMLRELAAARGLEVSVTSAVLPR
jgi:hypothetical protein